jgi:tryptophan synthase alpha chain
MNGIQRINNHFAQGKAFIAYLTAGDGGIERTLAAALALIEAGVNLLEIGVPFSDPIADGPVIQRASSRALALGTSLADVLWLTREIRKCSDIPLILFSYLNPILVGSQSDFFVDAKQAGVDGLLIVDCPIEEAENIHQACMAQHIAPIYVLTPSTPLARIEKISAYARGFLYYACRKGTTGIRTHLPEDFIEKITVIKTIVHVPVVVGFGISERQQAEQILQYADGVVVGSLFVKALEDGLSLAELKSLVKLIYPLGVK